MSRVMSDKEIVQLLSKAFREHSPDALSLLEKLEDVEYSDGLLRPLHYAVRYGHLEGCKALIKRGADINARTVLGNTPLEIAMQEQSDQHVNVIKLLLVAGAHGELTEPYADLIGGRAQLDRSRPQERKRRLPSALPSAKTTKALKEDKVNQLLESASLQSWFDRHWPKLSSMFAREQRSALTDSTFSRAHRGAEH